jgi:type IV secretory pathway VirB2 component (pilin)
LESSLSDPLGSSAVVAAVAWLQGTLLGTVATVLATICVAAVGLMMLSGRVPVRRGLSAILGCFILFGASTIAAGIRDSVTGLGGDVAWTPPAPAPLPVAAVAPPPPKPPAPAADPFAGAAVPTR